MTFGETLKSIRIDKNDSYRKLGEKLGITFTYIKKIEDGERPINKNILSKLIEVYPDKEKEFTEAYLKEVLPDSIATKVLTDNRLLLLKNNDELLINFLVSEVTPSIRKTILEIMLLQRENSTKLNGTYEENKEELEEIRKEIEKL